MSKDKVTIEVIEKTYGLHTISPTTVDVVSTGSILLNRALGCGGYALGKIIELQGAESSGKSTAVMHAIAEFQKKFPDKKVALFDYENSFDIDYATALGVDINKVIIYQPDNLEQGLNMIIELVKNDLVSLVCLDSHTSALPKKIIEGEIGDATIGLAARMYSIFLAKLKGLCEKNKITLIAISQLRANIGVMYGPSETTTSGNGWKFYSDVRIKFNKSIDKDGEKNDTTITVIKNKCGKPFGTAKISIEWGKGFDVIGEIIDICIEYGIISKGGAWLTYGDLKVQGKEKFKEMLIDNPEFRQELEDKIQNYA